MRKKLLLPVLFCCMLQTIASPAEKKTADVKVGIMDFTSTDIIARQRFLNSQHKPVVIRNECTLSPEDRGGMNSVMQGYVRMIDARDRSATNQANRELQIQDNMYNRANDIALYRKIAEGPSRPMLLGASYLSGYLGRHPDVFTCISTPIILAAMDKYRKSPDFPKDFMLQIAQETGATHLIYGTVSDIRSKFREFSGYGIHTKTTIYELDVVVKMADLPAQRIVYSGVYTGSVSERMVSGGGIEIDGNRYQTMMKAALEQAAEDLYEKFKKNQLKVTPVPTVKKMTVPEAAARKDPAPEKTAVSGSRKSEHTLIIQNVNPAGNMPPAPPCPVPVPSDKDTTVILNVNHVPVQNSRIIVSPEK